MSTRERWIVYPLLFMTLGIALRDKIMPHTLLKVDEIVCDRLDARRSECRTLLVNGPNGPVVAAGTDAIGRAGVVETFTANGAPQTQLLSTDSGGMVKAIGQMGKAAMMMGHVGQNFGVFVQVPDLVTPIPLTRSLRLGTAKPSSKPQEEPPPVQSETTPRDHQP